MLSKAPLASKPSAKQKTYPHGDFEDENNIGGARSGRFKERFYQQIVSTQTTDGVLSCADKSLAWQSGQKSFWQSEVGAKSHIVVALEHLPGVVGTTTPKATNVIGTPRFVVTPQSPYEYAGGRFRQ
jgi:hypothetical protein